VKFSPTLSGFQNVWGADRFPRSVKAVKAAIKVKIRTNIRSSRLHRRPPRYRTETNLPCTGSVLTSFLKSITVLAFAMLSAFFPFPIVVESAALWKGFVSFLPPAGKGTSRTKYIQIKEEMQWLNLVGLLKAL
jgi:hypothetical protein